MSGFVRNRASVHPAPDGKSFYLLLDKRVVGQTKLQCDAELHMHNINKAIDDAYDIGYRNGVNMVACGE